MKPKHKRLIIVGSLFAVMLIAGGGILWTLKQYAVFFITPIDVVKNHDITRQKNTAWRLGGLVAKNSIKSLENNLIHFTITDYQADVNVQYQGLVPSLFREGQGVVAEGVFLKNGRFKATKLLAKHDEYYMPKEVVSALKASGRWQHGGKPDASSVSTSKSRNNNLKPHLKNILKP
jgi:cytochrome c-type biogenesis protein CcmE